MAATSGTPPYTWSLVSQTGTNAFTVSSSGLVASAAAAAETDSLVIMVTDNAGLTSSGTFSVTLNSSVGTSSNFANVLMYQSYNGGAGSLGAVIPRNTFSGGRGSSGFSAACQGYYDNAVLPPGTDALGAAWTSVCRNNVLQYQAVPAPNTSFEPIFSNADGIQAGDEIWYSFKTFFPTGYSFRAGGVGLKWFGITIYGATGENTPLGHLYINYDNAGGWQYYSEVAGTGIYGSTGNNHFRTGTGAWSLTTNTWDTWDIYVKLAVIPVGSGGTGLIRMWKNKVLVGEITNAAILDTATSRYAGYAFFCDYWNGTGADWPSQNQVNYISDTAIAVNSASKSRNDTPFVGTDASGNKVLAVGY